MFTNTLNFKLVSNELIEAYIKRLHVEYSSKEIGYYHLPDTMMPVVDDSMKFMSECYANIHDVIIVGVGGSSLGTKAIAKMLKPKKSAPKLHFLDNLDPALIHKVFKKINIKKSLFFVVSKSGTTLETISIFKVVLQKLQEEYSSSKFYKKILVITDPNSSLETYAKKYKIKYFHIPKNVGGRFSVFSTASLVPLTICGYDTKALLEGAKSCEDGYLKNQNNTILQKAYKYAIHHEASINVLFSYSSVFREFNEWYIQLWAESLGKKLGFSRIGLTPIGLIGSSAQHSFLQLIVEGVKDKSVTFLKVKEAKKDITIPDIKLDFIKSSSLTSNFNMQKILNMQCDATMQSVQNEGILTDIIEIDKVDAWHVGYLMYYYMLLTSACGIMLGINTYSQPGVEVGKNILNAMLKSYKR